MTFQLLNDLESSQTRKYGSVKHNRNMLLIFRFSLFFLLSLFIISGQACAANMRIIPVAKGWAKSEVNAVIFRQHPLTTFGNEQYVAFYGEDSSVILARRKLADLKWDIRKTRYKGNVSDAHNSISIAVDGRGILHMSWDHHGHPLRYCRSITPGSLELTTKMPMTGQHETRVTYPEFYNLPDGGLLFLYRDGASGNGDLMINRYDVKTRKWSVVKHPLIHGQGQRNAYWQAVVDKTGTWHISWCWREHGGVESNHDICYARSRNEGKTWEKSTTEKYQLPITADNAEYVCRIPRNSDLINQTSMTVDEKGLPLIASFWKPEGSQSPQYQIIYHKNKKWHIRQVSRRRSPFSLKGAGTRRLSMSRPKILTDSDGNVYVIFRDSERGDLVSIAFSKDPQRNTWRIEDLSTGSLEMWEPGYDKVLWQRENILHLFLQKVHHGGRDLSSQMVSILEWKP